MSCDIVLVGVGGQGVLTLGDLLLRAAFEADVPASFCPTKGMAQRGGFVKVEIRLGQEGVGPRIGERGADVVIAMERSEALKAIPFVKPGGDFILCDHVWEPTGVHLGVDRYPSLDDVSDAIEDAGARRVLLRPSDVAAIGGKPSAANVFLLGALVGVSRVAELIDAPAVESVIAARWPKVARSNEEAFRSGLAAGQLAFDELPGSSPDSELPTAGGDG